MRWICEKKTDGVKTVCYQTTDPTVKYRGKGEVEKRVQFKQTKLAEKLVITWAQNATPVHEGFLAALKAYCRENRAQLIVIPGRYKNPTSTWSKSQRGDQYWSKEVQPYLLNQRTRLNENLMLLADINTQPTAVTPLSGFETITHAESGILGHPKLQMQTIATPSHKMPKIMHTTGAVTVENYTDTKAGKKGDFHHVIGALIIELDGPSFHLRQLNARTDGAFCDLDRAYYPDGTSRRCGPYEAVIFGDAHAIAADATVVQATFGKGGLVERLDPKKLVFHDLLDGYAINPHHQGNPFISQAKLATGRNDIRNEVLYTIGKLKSWTGKRHAIVVPSNHDDFLSRWIKSTDWREDLQNADFYLQTARFMLNNTVLTDTGVQTPDPFIYHVELCNYKNIRCLRKNEPFTIAGILCSLHGHVGPKGARGNRTNISKIGAKTFIGHSHAPGITEGCYQVGTMTPLMQEYTGPISDWLNCHGSIDPMRKRHLHICINGRFWK